MSESQQRPSRRHPRDIDIARSPLERLARPRVNWPWFLILCALVFVVFVLGNQEWPVGWIVLLLPGLVIGCGAAYVAWLLIVRRGVFTWRRLAQAPARALARGDAAEAERALAKALARARRFGPDDHRRGLMVIELAGYLKNQGRYPEARALFEEGVEIFANRWRANPLDYFIALNNFAIYHIHLHDYRAAQETLERVLDLTLIRKKEQQNKTVTVQYHDLDLILQLNLVFLFIQMHELGAAHDCLAEADALFHELPGLSRKRFRAHYHAIRALLRFADGRFADAADEIERAENPDYPACLRVRLKLHLVRQEFAQAELLAHRFLDLERKHGSTHRPDLRDHWLELAESLFGQGKHDDAFAAVQEVRAIVGDFALPPDTLWRRAMQSWLQRARELGRDETAAALAAEVQQLATVPEHGIMVSDRLRVRPTVP